MELYPKQCFYVFFRMARKYTIYLSNSLSHVSEIQIVLFPPCSMQSILIHTKAVFSILRFKLHWKEKEVIHKKYPMRWLLFGRLKNTCAFQVFSFFLTLSSLCSLIVCKIAVEARVASYRPGITCSFMDVLLKLSSSHPGILL